MRIGIDMGGTTIKFGLVDETDTIVARKVIPTRIDIPAEELIEDMLQAIKALMAEQNVKKKDCTGIGIGSPGTIDVKKGRILYSNNFGWENVDILAQMKKSIKTRFAIANDADTAALGEVCAGAAKGAENAILITLGTGVGGGIILNGQIFHGALAGGSEIGHMVIREGGERCTCGRRGCFEAYASATALLRQAKKETKENPTTILHDLCEYDLDELDGKMIFDACRQEDAVAKKVVDQYLNDLACGITNVINIFRPQIVILGGGVAAQKENLTRPLQERVNGMCFGGTHGKIAKIVTSKLGNDAGIIGAANLV